MKVEQEGEPEDVPSRKELDKDELTIRIEGLDADRFRRKLAEMLAEEISMPKLRKEAANIAYRKHLGDKSDELEETFNRVMGQRLKTEADREEMHWWERQHKVLKKSISYLKQDIEELKKELPDSKDLRGDGTE